MPELVIVRIGHPVLRKKAIEVSSSKFKRPVFRQFVQDMIEAMHEAQGVGLAANQVGRGIRAIVLECMENQRYPRAEGFPLEVWLNAKIIEHSKEREEDWEGCLSIPGYRGVVPRARSVAFEAVSLEGKKTTRTGTGFHARVIQHEIDHLDGFFYVDRMPDLKNWLHLEEFNRLFHTHIQDKSSST